MPTTDDYFNALERAIQSNNLDHLKIVLLTFDLSATQKRFYFGQQTCLMCCIRDGASPEALNLVFEKIHEAGDTDFFKNQLEMKNDYDENCLMISCKWSSQEVLKLVMGKIVEVGGERMLKKLFDQTDKHYKSCLQITWSSERGRNASLVALYLYHLDLFHEQITNLEGQLQLERMTSIHTYWRPSSEMLGGVTWLIHSSLFIQAIHNNQHSKVKEFMNKDESAKKLVDSNLDSVVRACARTRTTVETVKVLFAEIERIGGDQFLKDLVAKEDTAGETCLLSVLSNYPERLKLFLDTMGQKTDDGELPAEEAKRRNLENFCFYALIKFAPNYESLSLIISKIFETESLGRRYLRVAVMHSRCLECLFARSLDSPDDKKILYLMVSLCTITGLFEYRYSLLAEENKKTLSRICKIESGDWSRSARSTNSPMGDLIGEIKKSINKNQIKSPKLEQVVPVISDEKQCDEDDDFL